MLKPDESPLPVIPTPQARERNLLLLFPAKADSSSLRSVESRAQLFVFSGVIGRDFHAYSWAEGPCNTPRNDRGGLIFDGVEEGAFAT